MKYKVYHRVQEWLFKEKRTPAVSGCVGG